MGKMILHYHVLDISPGWTTAARSAAPSATSPHCRLLTVPAHGGSNPSATVQGTTPSNGSHSMCCNRTRPDRAGAYALASTRPKAPGQPLRRRRRTAIIKNRLKASSTSRPSSMGSLPRPGSPSNPDRRRPQPFNPCRCRASPMECPLCVLPGKRWCPASLSRLPCSSSCRSHPPGARRYTAGYPPG